MKAIYPPVVITSKCITERWFFKAMYTCSLQSMVLSKYVHQ